jgi:hypothetical protein
MMATVPFLLICGALFYFFFFRNEKVCRFRNDLNRRCYRWSMQHLDEDSAYNWLYDELPSYESMVFSFKPLDLEHWLTAEQIERLNN